jgi:cysteinyl-tRNA synthetase
MIFFDVVHRYLRHRGFDVFYVRNFTDVDDKIINRANERGENWKELAERFIEEFYTDMDALGILRPTVEPRATDHIPEIVSLVEKLIRAGKAYEADGDVMFSVGDFPGYGKLSGKKTDELIAGARVDPGDKKRDPLDFVLWKAAKPGEPSWESPWGPGRPGWHIECSAMSMKYLGESFDIHGGGADLVFPHHENEIAQSEAATGAPFVRYWIHNGFVNIRSEKMAKSLGNVMNIRDALKTTHPESLRLFLLGGHYRSPLDYHEQSIREAGSGLERLYRARAALDGLIAAGGTAQSLPEELEGLSHKFTEAMDDDFNTPKALAVLFDAARAVNRLTGPGVKKKTIPAPPLLTEARDDMLRAGTKVLGILNEEPAEFLNKARAMAAADLGLDVAEIEALIAERVEARKRKDFARADEIRDMLVERNVLLEDGPTGTEWRIRTG